ncbi:HAD-IA family hydrolase [Streptomyces sp. NBC_00638]|uniref:HAD family hydrolase n=1 Tax=unclassified Streptomyces TaxID=2593676 RepID=UPI002250099A|nr:HAD-IA family hydrolase [Streptomyces sp. NBC_00638]MCX5008318.1 HAD-IA family hydrolase [Streptomyces sp. NBC_00638]
MEHDLVIFDNSGVLADSETLGNQVLAALLTRLVVPTTFDEAVEHYLGKTLTDVAQEVRRRTGAVVPEGFVESFHTELFDVFEERLAAVEGVERVLDGLDALGVPYCVASNDTADRLALSLRRTGLLDRMTGRVFSSDMVERPKPAPDLFLHAAAQFGAAPERCLVIEDSPRGVAAARAAGMTVYGFASVTPRERLADAHRVFGVMDELADLLPELFPAPLVEVSR